MNNDQTSRFNKTIFQTVEKKRKQDEHKRHVRRKEVDTQLKQ